VAPKPTKAQQKERWVERVYRVPAADAGALDEAIEAARAELGGSDGQALVEIARRYLDT